MVSLHISQESDSLGQALMVGFQGTSIKDEGVKHVVKNAMEGKIGGIIFFRHNFIERQQIFDLVGTFKELKLEFPLFLAIDQEGGSGDFGERGVQRLWSGNSFKDFPTAQSVGETLSPPEAFTLYTEMAKDVKSTGLNLILGPVVDLYHPQSAAIGRLKRSFSSDPLEVTLYAQAFIDACHGQGLLTCLKHFPGHGLALKDSHKRYVDITQTFDPQELMPFLNLVEKGYKDLIMTAHVMHRDYDPDYPATLSQVLLKKWIPSSFEGLIISDDLMMAAIRDHYSLEEALILALHAGVDIVIISHNPKAYQGKSDSINLDQSNIYDLFIKTLDSMSLSFLKSKIEKIKNFKLNHL